LERFEGHGDEIGTGDVDEGARDFIRRCGGGLGTGIIRRLYARHKDGEAFVGKVDPNKCL
jgi:hypothetical protein